MPVYNSAIFIEAAIISVINQNYPNLEFIIIDGGSTDGTIQIIEKYSQQLAYFITEKDQGQSEAINKGFLKATGDVLAWLNADEEYLPGVLLKVGNEFRRNPKIDLVFGYRFHCDQFGDPLYLRRYPPIHPLNYMLYAARVLPTDATFWSKRAHEKTGMLNQKEYAHLAMDNDWLLRLSANIKNWKRLRLPLAKFKEHTQRKTLCQPGRAYKLGLRLTRDFAVKHGINKWQFIAGWLLWGTISRFYEPKWWRLPSIITVLQRIKKVAR